MDPLLSRLLLKTGDLKDPRQAFTVLTPTAFNACLSAAECDMDTGNPVGSVYFFDVQNMQRNLLLLETLQTTINGESLISLSFRPRQEVNCRENLRKP